MTVEEAIKIVTNEKDCFVRTLKNECPTGWCEECEFKVIELDTLDVGEALNMAIEALEKQIPKERNIKQTEIGNRYSTCSKCGKFLNPYEMMDILFYCPNCGQRLEKP